MNRTKLVAFVFVASLAAFCAPRLASAAAVASGTTALFSDHYEYDTVGTQPTSPEIGTWATASGGVLVTNAASPGPADGAKYLSLNRTPTNGGAFAVADFGAVSSGILTAYFEIFIPTGSSDNVVQISLAPVNTSPGVINISAAPVWLTNEGSTIHTYVAPGGDPLGNISTGVSFTTGVWQRWTINYTFGGSANDDTFTFAIDGNSSASINAGGFGNVADPASLRYLGFRVGAATGTFYVDLVPEPMSGALLAFGVAALLKRRR